MTARSWPIVPLADVLALDLDRVPVEPTTTYNMVGVYSFGRGLFCREPVHGGSTSYKHFYRLADNHVVMSQLFGWEGALALSTPEFAGRFVSPQFPTFRCDTSKLDRTFLGWWMRRPLFWGDLGGRTKGMGDRRRTLNPDALLACNIPLPALAEQRRIVAKIDHLAAKISEARGLREQATAATAHLLDGEAGHRLACAGATRVGDFLSIQSGYAFKSEWFAEQGVRLVRNVNIGHGSIDWGHTARIPMERRDEFARFALDVGDILITLDRPIISTGVKVACVTGADVPSLLLQRVGRVQFKSKAVVPEFFFAWLRSPQFVGAIDPGRSNGVPHISPKDVEGIPFAPPPTAEQRRIVAYLDDLQARVDRLKALQAQTAAELDALLPAILDKAFKGEL